MANKLEGFKNFNEVEKNSKEGIERARETQEMSTAEKAQEIMSNVFDTDKANERLVGDIKKNREKWEEKNRN